MTTRGASQAARRGRIRVEESAKRVRAFLGGEVVADSTRPVLVWEVPYYPAYYFPLADVRADLRPDGGSVRSPSRGDGRTYTVRAGSSEAPGAALRYEDSPIAKLRNLVRLDWHAMDAWFEEDEEVFTHPRDPYTRVDILASSRHVRVDVGGATVAESTSPRLLFETGLPVRYYLPKPHVRLDLLLPTPHREPLSVQGPGRVLVGAGARRRPRGPRLVVPVAAAREPEDRGSDRLLQREDGHLRRRCAAGAALHQVLRARRR